MADGYVSQVQLPNNETYDIKDKNAVKDISINNVIYDKSENGIVELPDYKLTNSDIPGNVSFTKGEKTRDILVKDFGTAYGIQCYKGTMPLSFTSSDEKIDEWKIYGSNSPTNILTEQGQLSFDIDTYGGNAEDWEIFGNNNPIVENKTSTLPIDASATAGNLLDYTIYGNNDIGKNVIQLGESQTRNGVTLTIDSQTGTVIMNGDTTALEAVFSFNLFDTSSLVSGDYIFSGGADGGSSTTYDLYLYNRTDQVYVGRLYNSSDIISATIESGKRYTVYVQCRKGQVYDNIVFKPMLRPANTTSTFEPYIIGVGEKTKNLLSVEDITGGVNPQVTITRREVITGSIEATTTSGTTYRQIYWYPEFEEGQTYILSCYVNKVNEHARLCFRKRSGNQVIVSRWFTSTGAKTMEFTYTSEAYPGGVYVSLMLNDSEATEGEINISELMLRKADTTSDFKPFGYIIPVQSKQRTKNMLEITTESQTISGVTFMVDRQAGTISIDGTVPSSANIDLQLLEAGEILSEPQTFVASIDSIAPDSKVYLGFRKRNQSSGISYITVFPSSSVTITLGEGEYIDLVYIAARKGQTLDNVLVKPMIRLTDTSSDFEPYYNINQTDIYIGNSPLTQGQSITKAQSGQDIALFNGDNIIDTSLYNKPDTSITYNSSVLGVGEWNTPQVYTEWEQGTRVPTTQGGETYDQIKSNASSRVRNVNLIPVVTPFYYEINSGYQIGATFFDENGLSLGSSSNVAFRSAPYTYTGEGKYVSFAIKNDASTAITPSSDFEVKIASPYGYQIPLLVTSGQQSTPHTIYIGDSPLTEGQLVTKASSDTDIALYQGNNTISTILGNRPEMKIDYLSTEVGVGERTKNFVRATVGATVAGITFTVDSIAGTVTANGTSTGNTQLRIAINNPEDPNNTTVPPGNYYFSGCPSGGSGSSYNCYSWDADTGSRSKQWDGTTNVETDVGQGNCQVKINGHRQGILLRIAEGYTANNVVFKPMLRRADTTAEFEPYGYQIPIQTYQRTSNLLNLSNIDIWQNGLHIFEENQMLRIKGKTTNSNTIFITKLPSLQSNIKYWIFGETEGNAPVLMTLFAGSYPILNITEDGAPILIPTSNFPPLDIYLYPQLNEEIDITLSLMLQKNDEKPNSFEPYYIINNTNIYIGSSPLYEGEYVNETGIFRKKDLMAEYKGNSHSVQKTTEEIPSFNGSNLINTTLKNNIIKTELHPTDNASWICDELNRLERKIDSVDSSLGGPYRRNYLVTWCSEERISQDTTELSINFENYRKYFSGSILSIESNTTLQPGYSKNIHLLRLIHMQSFEPYLYNYAYAGPGKYYVNIHQCEIENLLEDNSITLVIQQENGTQIRQKLEDLNEVSIPFEIPDTSNYGSYNDGVTAIYLEVEIHTEQENFGAFFEISVIKESLLIKNGETKEATTARSQLSIYDENQQLKANLTTLQQQVTALSSLINQLNPDAEILIYESLDNTMTAENIEYDITNLRDRLKYIDIYYTDNNFHKGWSQGLNIISENYGYLRIPYDQISKDPNSDSTRFSLALFGDENSYFLRKCTYYINETQIETGKYKLFIQPSYNNNDLTIQFTGTPGTYPTWSSMNTQGTTMKSIKIYRVKLIVSAT